MNRMTWPSAAAMSPSTAFSRSSNSPRYLAPASSEPRSSAHTRLPFRPSGMSPATMRWARPSTIAVLPTPGSPISTGLFLVRRESTWIDAAHLVVAADHRIELAGLGERRSGRGRTWRARRSAPRRRRTRRVWPPRRSRSAREQRRLRRRRRRAARRAPRRASRRAPSSRCSVAVKLSPSARASADRALEHAAEAERRGRRVDRLRRGRCGSFASASSLARRSARPCRPRSRAAATSATESRSSRQGEQQVVRGHLGVAAPPARAPAAPAMASWALTVSVLKSMRSTSPDRG